MCLATDADLGRNKADILIEKVTELNKGLKTLALNVKMIAKNSHETPTISQSIIQKQDIIISGVDTFESRLAIDTHCISHNKIWIDSGTEDYKCSTQVIVPHIS
jgi:molybdopterin/thiamine biosynthesis adenylyltransferase